MYLTHMRPEQIQDAVARNVPVVMAAAVIEYHGPHLPVGTDILIAEMIAEQVEQRCECIVAPSIPFGPTMGWAGGIKDGDIDFEPEPFYLYVKEILKNLMQMGFKRIYVIQHHAGTEGLQSLCIRRVAAELIREVGRSWGEGWGRRKRDDYPNPDVFQWIKVAEPTAFSASAESEQDRPSFGHAGKGETAFIMARHPETVNIENLRDSGANQPYWLQDAALAEPEQGKKWLEYCVQGWVRELGGSSLQPE